MPSDDRSASDDPSRSLSSGRRNRDGGGYERQVRPVSSPEYGRLRMTIRLVRDDMPNAHAESDLQALDRRCDEISGIELLPKREQRNAIRDADAPVPTSSATFVDDVVELRDALVDGASAGSEANNLTPGPNGDLRGNTAHRSR